MTLGLLPLLLSAMVAGPTGPMPAAPVLYVRFIGPEGTMTVFHPASPLERTYKNPTTAAMRPGYIYRVGMVLPDQPDRPLYPSLEVRGSLNAPPGYDFTKYPVPITITADEVVRIRKGAMLTKVIYLENPDKAIALQTTNDEPLQFSAVNEKDAFKEAALRGRVVAVLRIGERDYSRDELLSYYVPGTLMTPDDKILPPAAAPPFIPCYAVNLYDPILGPKWDTDECLFDGGDTKRPLGIDNDRKLQGLDPSDTSMEYTIGTKRKVTSSNRVCICVPRFVSFAAETLPDGLLAARGPAIERMERGGVYLKAQQLPALTKQADIIALMKARAGLRATVGQVGLAQHEWSTKPIVMAAKQGTMVVGEIIGLDEISSSCDIFLMKWYEPKGPHEIGDVVTFYLRYANPSNEALTDVVVSDSLTARLEYVPGSAKSERPANFTMTPNEAGSVVLRWHIPGQLQPGQHGVVSFQAKIR